MSKEYIFLEISIIKKFQTGDFDAFEEVYKHYQSHIFRMAYQFTKNEESARDIVQETFLKAFKYREGLQHPEAIFTWLSKIAYRKCVDYYEKSKKDASFYSNDYEDGFPEERFEDQHQVSAIDQMQMKEAKEVILSAFEEMKVEWKLTGYLRFFEELSIKEIAEVMDVPSGTVLSRLSRIKVLLKEKLEQHDFTKDTCFSALLVPNMVDCFQASKLMNTSLLVEDKKGDFDKIKSKQNILKVSKKGHLFFGVMLVVAVVLPISAITLKSNLIPTMLIETKAPAVITHIDYDQNLTNKPLKIDVKTSNENYDQIQVDGKSEPFLTKNGEYHVSILKSGKIIDQKSIEIKNIDMDIPIVIDEAVEDTKITFTVDDTDSEVDFSKVVLLEKGNKKEFDVDRKSKKISVKKEDVMDYILEVPDIVGNKLKIIIKIQNSLE